MKNRIYQLPIDADLDLRFKELQKQFAVGEKLVSTSVHEELRLMIITTEVAEPTRRGQSRNLLLEEIDSGKIPPSVLGLKKD